MIERVVVIGDALIDEIRDDRGVREFVGGAALNVAVGLAVLDVPTTLVAMVGDDEPGQRIRTFLSTFGVTLLATPAPHGTARAVSERAGGAEPVYVFNEAARRRRILFGDAERAAVAAAPVTAVSCVAFDDSGQADDLAAVLASRGGALVIDPNPRSGMLADRDAFVRGFEAVVPGADLIKVGDDDAALLYGVKLDTVRDRMSELGAQAVLATAGAKGAAVAGRFGVVTEPIATAHGPVVDTMGAGDSMTAAFVAGLRAGIPRGAGEWAALLRGAQEIAAATVRHEGALLRRPRRDSADAGS